MESELPVITLEDIARLVVENGPSHAGHHGIHYPLLADVILKSGRIGRLAPPRMYESRAAAKEAMKELLLAQPTLMLIIGGLCESARELFADSEGRSLSGLRSASASWELVHFVYRLMERKVRSAWDCGLPVVSEELISASAQRCHGDYKGDAPFGDMFSDETFSKAQPDLFYFFSLQGKRWMELAAEQVEEPLPPSYAAEAAWITMPATLAFSLVNEMVGAQHTKELFAE